MLALAVLGLGVGVAPATLDHARPAVSLPPTGGDNETASPPASPSSHLATAEARQPAKEATTAKATTKKARAKVPTHGPGRYVGARKSIAPASATGALRRYDVRVEKGLDIDPQQAARLIEEVLNDQRSWRGTGRWRFQLVPIGKPADLHAYLATPGTTDQLCAPLLTRGEVSCQNGNRVVLNAKRWTYGVAYYGHDVADYRRYLINHEFGHALGHDHVSCPRRGQPAPVMMQQTKGLDGCRRNPWPLRSDD